MQRDRIDFAAANVGELFRKQLVPTVLGMVFTALFVITDGIFVGRGIGSDALAAVNIVAPLFVLAAGVGLMFGMGGAVVASVNLSRGKLRVANINATQAVTVSAGIMLLVSLGAMLFPRFCARMLGAPGDILDLAAEYLFYFAIFLAFQTALGVLGFFVRMDAPRTAMWAMSLAAVINIGLDYLFIFTFGWGMTGAAVATGIGQVAGVVFMLVYLQGRSPRIRLGRLKFSAKSLRLTARNTGYMVRLGSSAFLGEAAIAVMVLVGNYVFVRYLGTVGVAAFSVVCYFFPIIYMLFNGITQAAQPIISFNYGCGAGVRVRQALRLSLWATLATGVFFSLVFTLLRGPLVSLFIGDPANEAWRIAVQGLPLFAAGFVFFGINVVAVGYNMSVENMGRAALFTLLRGVILPPVCFFVLPLWWGVPGIWLAVPVAEALTTGAVALVSLSQRYKRSGTLYSVDS